MLMFLIYQMITLIHVYFLCAPGKLCIEVTNQSKIVWISESLCIGCGICIKASVLFDQVTC